MSVVVLFEGLSEAGACLGGSPPVSVELPPYYK